MTDLLTNPGEVLTELFDEDEQDAADLARATEIVRPLELPEAKATGLSADLARAFKLTRQLGFFPGRTLIMRHLRVTDTRARKLKDLGDPDPAPTTSPRTPTAGPGRTSGDHCSRALPPGGPQLPPGAPAGATPPNQPEVPEPENTGPAEHEQPPTATPPPASPAAGDAGGGVQVDTQPANNAPAPDQVPAAASAPPAASRSALPITLMMIAAVAAAIPAHLVAPANWHWARTGSAVLLGLAVGASIMLVVQRRHNAQSSARNSDTTAKKDKKVKGAVGYYMAAVLSMAMSVDTSWRFFRDVLLIEDIRERVIMFAVLEVALLACGWGMRANVKAKRSPGAPRMMAWLLCGFSGYMALYLSGLGIGLARVVLGPVIGIAMVEFALGIERHIVSNTNRVTTWGRVTRELRERVLSLLGLADDARDALARTRDRAAQRAARLAAGKFVLLRGPRLRRALRKSNVAHDPAAHHRMLADLAMIRHANDLTTLVQPSPWTTGGTHPSRTGQN